ncbi:MAG: DUF262 domain-containing protein [Methylococcales bacterium]|nr:DUF262 domain-containing protein [Methylococcales bacterium]
MNDKISVKPDATHLDDLLQDVKNGKYKIPKFQRDFVWTPDQMLELFDSILKGYPIGSLLFWETSDVFKCKEEVGCFVVKETAKSYSYILDGVQRISTLFGTLMNPKSFDSDIIAPDKKDFLIYFDIKENVFIYAKSKKTKTVFLAPLYEIYDNKELFNLFRKLNNENITDIDKEKYFENARDLHDILHKYRLPFVEIKGGDIKSSIDIFKRINSTGQEISMDFMLSALNYNDDSGFTFSDVISDFLDNLNKYNFQNIKRDTIINCIASSRGKIYFDIKSLELELKDDLENRSSQSFIFIEKAISFLYKKLYVLDIGLLPYPTQLNFIYEYFRVNPNPSDEELKKLENWFWITTYSNYFTIYSLSQQRAAYNTFKEFSVKMHCDGIYKDDKKEQFSTAKFPKKVARNSVRAKVIQLFMLKQISSDIQFNESIKEQFIFPLKNDRTRTPANMILRLGSEFEKDKDKKDISYFIKNSDAQTLEKYFINEKIKKLYIDGKVEEFIKAREQLIQEKEKEFVNSLGITYIN